MLLQKERFIKTIVPRHHSRDGLMSSFVAVVGEDGGAKSWRLVRWRTMRAFGTKLRWERDFTTRSKTTEDEMGEEHRW